MMLFTAARSMVELFDGGLLQQSLHVHLEEHVRLYLKQSLRDKRLVLQMTSLKTGGTNLPVFL